MKEKIISAIDDPKALENLYREDPALFTSEFNIITDEYDTNLVRFWKIRLDKKEETKITGKNSKEITSALIVCLVIAFLVRVPILAANLNMEGFYMRNLALIVFSGLTAWFVIKNKLTEFRDLAVFILPVIILAVYLNALPGKFTDSVDLALLHAPLLLWFFFGMAYLSFQWRDHLKMMNFIRYNGELIIMTGLLVIAWSILSAMTIGLFGIIGQDISRIFAENVVTVGMAVSPILAALLIDIYPDITGRVAPVIARIFAPLVLVAAVIYLISITVVSFQGINISGKREFLIIFNLLLLGVMAIILFSVSEQRKTNINRFQLTILFVLTLLTLLIDLFALWVIISRLSLGITPNRSVVFLSNVLILGNLVAILPGLYRSAFRNGPIEQVEKIICRYFPVYFIYSIAIVFIFPFIFG